MENQNVIYKYRGGTIESRSKDNNDPPKIVHVLGWHHYENQPELLEINRDLITQRACLCIICKCCGNIIYINNIQIPNSPFECVWQYDWEMDEGEKAEADKQHFRLIRRNPDRQKQIS